MITLAEFLREQGPKAKIEAAANAETIKEWRTAVEQLFQQIATWLHASDPENILGLQQDYIEVREPSLGRYQMPRLSLDGLKTWISIIPKARNTVGTVRLTPESGLIRATGRVDISDDSSRYVLFRVPVEGKEIWMIVNMGTEPKPFDQMTFEQILLSYLR